MKKSNIMSHLEELIDQDESLAILHPKSVNGIRATAVRSRMVCNGRKLLWRIHFQVNQWPWV